MIRLVAADLDGTLWGPDMVVPERHAQAIGELARRGVTVLAATSRRPRSAGALAVLADFRWAGLEPCVYVEDPDVDVLVSPAPSTYAALLDYLGELAGVEDLDAALRARPVYALSVLGVARERLEPATRLLRASGAGVILYAEPRYSGYGLIVNPPGISKWTGLEAFCLLSGISTSEVLAVRDGDNDLTMLSHAAVAVAVKGRTERALAAADHVIDPPGEHGWASLPDLI